MFSNRRVIFGLVVAMATVVTSACSRAPQEAIDQVQSALSAADEAGAATYAPEAWESAQEAVNAAMAEVEAQNAKFALTRSYKDASQMLVAAQQAAAEAQDAAAAGKEEMRIEVEDGIATIVANLEAADGLLGSLASCRRRPKGFASDLEIMRGNVDGLRAQLVQVQATADDGNYFEANTMAESLLEGINAVVTDMENAKAKLGC